MFNRNWYDTIKQDWYHTSHQCGYAAQRRNEHNYSWEGCALPNPPRWRVVSWEGCALPNPPGGEGLAPTGRGMGKQGQAFSRPRHERGTVKPYFTLFALRHAYKLAPANLHHSVGAGLEHQVVALDPFAIDPNPATIDQAPGLALRGS